jgi:hypothetical protein
MPAQRDSAVDEPHILPTATSSIDTSASHLSDKGTNVFAPHAAPMSRVRLGLSIGGYDIGETAGTYVLGVGSTLLSEAQGALGVAVEGLHVAADLLRLGEQVGRTVTGIGGEVQYRSQLVGGALNAYDHGYGSQTGEAALRAYAQDAAYDAASLGAFSLYEAGKESWEKNDPTPFAKAAGAIEGSLLAGKAMRDAFASRSKGSFANKSVAPAVDAPPPNGFAGVNEGIMRGLLEEAEGEFAGRIGAEPRPPGALGELISANRGNAGAPRPVIKTGLPDRVTNALPEDVGRSAAETARARNFYKRNIKTAREWWQARTGEKWPDDPEKPGAPQWAEHQRSLKDGGDPLHIEPGVGPDANARHVANGDSKRFGKMGGRPRKNPQQP